MKAHHRPVPHRILDILNRLGGDSRSSLSASPVQLMKCASAEPHVVRAAGCESAAVRGPVLGDQLYALTPAGVPGAEAWIEDVQRRGELVVVTLCLADGTEARSVLAGDHADWLDLRPGQIVTVAATSAGGPGLPVLGE
jgi:hypothetical protein